MRLFAGFCSNQMKTGKYFFCRLQQTLHRNLMYLATLADGGQSLMAELQTPLDDNGQSQQSAVPAESQPVPIDKGKKQNFASGSFKI